MELKEVNFKEANRRMWMVKGQLIPDQYKDSDIEDLSNSYFNRIWYNEEAYIYEEGFEEAYREKYGE